MTLRTYKPIHDKHRPDPVRAFQLPENLFDTVESGLLMLEVEDNLKEMDADLNRRWRWVGKRLAVPRPGGSYQYATPGDWIIEQRWHASTQFKVVSGWLFKNSYTLLEDAQVYTAAVDVMNKAVMARRGIIPDVQEIAAVTEGYIEDQRAALDALIAAGFKISKEGPGQD